MFSPFFYYINVKKKQQFSEADFVLLIGENQDLKIINGQERYDF